MSIDEEGALSLQGPLSASHQPTRPDLSGAASRAPRARQVDQTTGRARALASRRSRRPQLASAEDAIVEAVARRLRLRSVDERRPTPRERREPCGGRSRSCPRLRRDGRASSSGERRSGQSGRHVRREEGLGRASLKESPRDAALAALASTATLGGRTRRGREAATLSGCTRRGREAAWACPLGLPCFGLLCCLPVMILLNLNHSCEGQDSCCAMSEGVERNSRVRSLASPGITARPPRGSDNTWRTPVPPAAIRNPANPDIQRTILQQHDRPRRPATVRPANSHGAVGSTGTTRRAPLSLSCGGSAAAAVAARRIKGP